MNLPDSISRPLLITSAVVAGLGPLVGNGVYAGAEGTGADLQRNLADPDTVAYVGYSLELVGFVAMATVFGALCTWIHRQAPVAAAVTGIAAAAGLAVKVGTVTPTLAVAAADDPLDPATVDALVSVGDMGFVVSGYLLGLAFAAAGLGLLRSSAPRWLAWWPTVAGALGVTAAIVGITAPDAYFPLFFVLLLVWLVALGLAGAFGRTQATSHTPEAVGVG